MKSLKYLLSLTLLATVLISCEKDEFNDTSFVNSDIEPAQLSALFSITQDNTGLVTITPNGEGASSYDVYFGDGTVLPAKVQAGDNIEHIYEEGEYEVRVVGYSVSGKVSESEEELTVSFRAPEELAFTTEIDEDDNFKLTVSAEAIYETMFKVYFGEDVNETPQEFIEGETVSHTYATTGTYTVKVVAFSGGAATSELTKTVTIVNPTLLPLNFESSTVNYTFDGFGGAYSSRVDNPSVSGINQSAKVMQTVKGTQQPWAGSVITLSEEMDFSVNKFFRMKVYAPIAGAKVTIKVENLTNGDISKEGSAYTTVANKWEDLIFDFSEINTGNTYQKLVVFHELGTTGDGSPNFTLYFDDINLTSSKLVNLPINFESSILDYSFTDFGGGASTNVVDNPSESGINTSDKVGKMVKNGGESWSGTFIPTNENLDISVQKVFKMKVYSPAIGTLVKFKLDDGNNHGQEVDAVTTTANTWEELTFDFTGKPSTYKFNQVVLFFDFLIVGNGSSAYTYYFDDITVN